MVTWENADLLLGDALSSSYDKRDCVHNSRSGIRHAPTVQGISQREMVTTPSGNPSANRMLNSGPAKHAEMAISGSVRATAKFATRSPIDAPQASTVWPKKVSSIPVAKSMGN